LFVTDTIRQYQEVLRLKPDYAAAQKNLKTAQERKNKSNPPASDSGKP
jgi:hypothetical protein